MLTLEKFLEVPDDSDFARGVAIDNSDGLNMTGSGKLLKWIAIKGWINGWYICTHFAEHDFEFIKTSGDKVMSQENIQKLVPCVDEVFKKYSY